MTTRKTLLNELPSYGIKGTASYAWDVAKSKVGLADASTVQLRAMVSDLARGVGEAPNRFFTWFSKNIGMSVGGIKKYLGSMWSSVGSSNNIFMKVIHQIGSAIGSAINYAVKLLSPLIAQAKTFMGTNVRGLYGVTNGHLVVGVVIFACIVFVVYKIYKRIKNRNAKKQTQSQTQQTPQTSQTQQTPQTPQEVVKESKEMLRDIMDAITEGVNTFKCCDKLTEGLGIKAGVATVAKITKMAGNICCRLYNEWLGKKSEQPKQSLGQSTGENSATQQQNSQQQTAEGFNIFEGDYYDREPRRPGLLQNKVFISTALLCIAFVLGFFAFTNLATGISGFLKNQRSVSGFWGVIWNSQSRMVDIQKIALSPKVLGAAAGAGIAFSASRQIAPTREYR